MAFTDLSFAALVVIAFAFYYARGSATWQVGVLIVASLGFYAYGQPALLTLLLFSALVNGLCSYGVLAAREHRSRLCWAAAGIVINLATLVCFKYNRLLAELIIGELSSVKGLAQLALTLPLPVGISFYTFHGISLLVDVLRKRRLDAHGGSEIGRPARHLGYTLLYLTFFPQLIAGPIARAHFFYPQIAAKRIADIDWSFAVKCLILGYFLKMVVADNLQQQTIWIAYPYFLHFPLANLAALLFAYSMQIFADFAGYSLIAIGLAALFCYRLPENFNFPYVSRSVTEFWRRWHISLSSWLKDYLYIPLGGNKRGTARTYINLLVVMFLGGLWHGAALSYAVWGTCHGFALALERALGRFAPSWFASAPLQLVRVIAVFAFVSLAWLLFKLPNFNEVLLYLRSMAVNRAMPPIYFYILVIGIFSLPVILYHAVYQLRGLLGPALARMRPAIYGALLSATILNSGPSSAFIYFQF